MHYFQVEFTSGAQQLETADHNNGFLLMICNTIILFVVFWHCSNFSQKYFHCLWESKVQLAIEIHDHILQIVVVYLNYKLCRIHNY